MWGGAHRSFADRRNFAHSFHVAQGGPRRIHYLSGFLVLHADLVDIGGKIVSSNYFLNE